jgi:CheY-like chemotaxis protein
MITEPIIVYVEDDPGSRKIMRVLIKQIMALPHLNILEDSSEFLSKIDAITPRPNLFLLDIHIEPHDGFELLTMLRVSETFKNALVVALTASVMNEEVQRLKTAGFDGVIAKPINLDTFPALLNRVLEGEQIWTVVG